MILLRFPTPDNDAHYLRPRRSEATRKRLVDAPCYVARGDHALYLKQEALYARIHSCDHGISPISATVTMSSTPPLTAGTALSVSRSSAERFCTCGDYLQGVARIRCTNPECGHYCFRPFSCRGFYLCPLCSRKRTILFAEHLTSGVLPRLPHRQFVFTMPRVGRFSQARSSRTGHSATS